MRYPLEPQVLDPTGIQETADYIQTGSYFVAWLYVLYIGRFVRDLEYGSIKDFDEEMNRRRGSTGFAYVRFEDYPEKYALITFRGRNYRGRKPEPLDKAKEEVKKLVGKVDVEIETDVPLTLDDIKRHAEKRALQGKHSRIDYLEQLIRNLNE